AEVEAIDHRRRPRARLDHSGAPSLVVLRRRGPGDVVDGAGALEARLGRWVVVGVDGAAVLPASLPEPLVARGEAERVREQRPARRGVACVGADAGEALQRAL